MAADITERSGEGAGQCVTAQCTGPADQRSEEGMRRRRLGHFATQMSLYNHGNKSVNHQCCSSKFHNFDLDLNIIGFLSIIGFSLFCYYTIAW